MIKPSPLSGPRLARDFYARPTLKVARDLIGKMLVCGDKRGIITETEAYIGQNDPACHAARGKTPRNEVMFGHPGVAYVYFIYGMYHCLNLVTEDHGFPAAVLIRGVQEIGPNSEKLTHWNGPGKLCKAFGITKEAHNGIDTVTSNMIYVSDTPLRLKTQKTPRIGISAGQEKLWRFVAVRERKFL